MSTTIPAAAFQKVATGNQTPSSMLDSQAVQAGVKVNGRPVDLMGLVGECHKVH